MSLDKKATSMNPAIWSDLFARLPLAGIIRLQCLSKQWNKILNSRDFRQVCTDAHPKMFAIITSGYKGSAPGSLNVELYDLRSNTWYAIQIDYGYQRRVFYTMNASDGGLVCFACLAMIEGRESLSVLVLVCNPLTRVVRALPLHSHYKYVPTMLQLVMDRVSKCYEVLIVSTHKNGDLVGAEVFHSNTGAWTTANLAEKRYFPGFRDQWYGNFLDYRCDEGAPCVNCVYDCAEGHFLKIPAIADLLGHESYFPMHDRLFVQDRLFVLCGKEREAMEGGGLSEPEYFFAEFQFLESETKWLKLKDHRSTNLGFSRSTWCILRKVFACKGFMLVVTRDFEEWLYDLSTGKWHALSLGFPELSQENLMCELQWDVVP